MQEVSRGGVSAAQSRRCVVFPGVGLGPGLAGLDVSPLQVEEGQALHHPGSDEPTTRIAHPDFFDALEGRARHYGALIGARYGEAYTTPEPVGVTDLVSLYDREAWKQES